jgi:hypothetical protein
MGRLICRRALPSRDRLAKLIKTVGEANVLAVNTECVYLTPGTQHNFTEVYDTNCYENLGKVMEEAYPKSIRGKLYEARHQEPVEFIAVPEPPSTGVWAMNVSRVSSTKFLTYHLC